MKLLVATPVYNNQLDSRMVAKILDFIRLCQERNVAISWDRPSSCLISYNRNLSASLALKEEYDYLLFVDADTVFDKATDILDCLIDTAYKKDVSVVGAPVRLKTDSEKKIWNFCFKIENAYRNWEGALPPEPLECDIVGCGVMLIKVSILKEIKPPWFEQLDTYHEDNTVGFFPEDYYFCEKVKNAGKKIFVDPRVKTTHWGYYGYR